MFVVLLTLNLDCWQQSDPAHQRMQDWLAGQGGLYNVLASQLKFIIIEYFYDI